MIRKPAAMSLVLLLVLIVATGTGCQQRYLDMNAVERIVRMENPEYENKPIPKHVMDSLASLVETYHNQIAAYANDKGQLQLLYKNIAQRYLDIGYYEQQIEYYTSRIEAGKNLPSGADKKVYYDYAAIMLMQKKLYSDAYANLQESLKLSPDNTFLLYYSGYCAGLIGKAIRPDNESEGMDWLGKAVKYYQQALKTDPDYIDALYGISIIYVYELGQPEMAIPSLLHIKEQSKENVDALFVLAAAYTMTENYRAAIAEYTEIEKITSSDEKKKAATDNIRQLQAMQ
ncbi:MAG: hypothetical protein EHM28_06150 [Spirochaetaceae bacterium]|nr:MAG: hypothetical protein EHM28_06150 [Spirochaetaceae bacterium]